MDATIGEDVTNKNDKFIDFLSEGKVKISNSDPKGDNNPTNKKNNKTLNNQEQPKESTVTAPMKYGLNSIIKNFEKNKGINSIEIYFYVLKAKPIYEV